MNIKHRINDFLTKTTGYRLTKSSATPDLRGKVTDPREGIYHAKTFPFIMDLPFDKGGDWLYSTYTENSSAAYYQAAKAALRVWGQGETAVKKEIERVLTDFASLVTIEHPNQLLGLTRDESKFNDAKKVYEMVLPWDSMTVEALAKMRGDNILAENKRYGLNTDTGLISLGGCEEKVQVEVKRIFELLFAIKTSGFIDIPENLITVRLHFNTGSDDFVWRVTGGMHRSAILAAMGWQHLPVKVAQIVYRDEVAFWPAVTAGYYSQDAALKVFDRIFNADPPPVNQNWIEKVKSYKAN